MDWKRDEQKIGKEKREQISTLLDFTKQRQIDVKRRSAHREEPIEPETKGENEHFRADISLGSSGCRRESSMP